MEVFEEWTLDDLQDAHDLLELENKAQERMMKEAKRKKN